MHGNIVWASNYELQCLTILQKRAIGVIVGDTYRASAVARFEEINMMIFESISKYQIGIFVYNLYKYVNGKLPVAFKDFFVRVEDSH